MANTLTTPKRAFGKLLNAVAIAAALCASSASQAGVIDFETQVDSPFVMAGEQIALGNYYVEGNGTAGLVGAIVDNSSCAGIQCPVNNATTYYAGLDDGYLAYGSIDRHKFRLDSLDASFIGTGQSSFPTVAGLLYIAGYDENGFVADTYLDLAGPVGGQFRFNHLKTGSFYNYLFTDVLIATFACDGTGNCDRTSNKANFALDNIAMTDIPEPGSFALIGLGLLGLGAFARRRAA